MKTLLLLSLFVVATASVRADWNALKAGNGKSTALQLVGAPLMTSKSRSGLQETWTYDSGGYILFESGRVRYWQRPRVASKSGANQTSGLLNRGVAENRPQKSTAKS